MGVDVRDVNGTFSIDSNRWMMASISTVVEEIFGPCSVPAVHETKTVRASARIIVSVGEGHFALFACCAVDVICSVPIQEVR